MLTYTEKRKSFYFVDLLAFIANIVISFIDAAKEARVEHVIFLTPFTPLDPISPPASPGSEQHSSATATPVIYGSYRSQFMLIESYLHSQFDNNGITILRYPGVLHQHLLVFSKYI